MILVPANRQTYIGFPGGPLKDGDSMADRVAKLKPGQAVKLMGTAVGNEVQKPKEETKFVEDLTAEERVALLKERKVVVTAPGLRNLGNTCYLASLLQTLNSVTSLKEALNSVGEVGTVDGALTLALRSTLEQMNKTSDTVAPMQLWLQLQQRFPQFAERTAQGVPMQQDAEECLRGLFDALSATLTEVPAAVAGPVAVSDADPFEPPQGQNVVDRLFGIKLRRTLKCTEAPSEEPRVRDEYTRSVQCFMGDQLNPIGHLHAGIQLSLKGQQELTSETLGRVALYDADTVFESLPPFLIVQQMRFQTKEANVAAGTKAAAVKLTRRCTFSQTLDVYDFCADRIQKQLSKARRREKRIADKALEQERLALGAAPEAEKEDVHKVDDADVPNCASTGKYQLVAIVSHKGRTLDGGHYVGWVRIADQEQVGPPALGDAPAAKRAKKPSPEDESWLEFDDETVTDYKYSEMVGMGVDLQGGKADTQIAYLLMYKRMDLPDEEL